MAAQTSNNMPVNPDTTFVTVKVAFDGTNRRFKLALRDLGANVFPDKLRSLLGVRYDAQVIFERYSDSAASYVTLDSNNPAIYKQLYRAAKAKLKLRIRATAVDNTHETEVARDNTEITDIKEARPRSTYLETVLDPVPSAIESDRTTLKETVFPNTTTETLVEPAKQTDSASALPSVSPIFQDFPTSVFCIDCNNCGNSIPGDHYHCSVCDDGDFDLCMQCVATDVHCGGDGHWLIKRSLQNGRVVSSTTQIIAPKKETVIEHEIESQDEVKAEPMMEATSATKAELASAICNYAVERTCNSCIGEFPNSEFVSCTDCYDFDLCESCLIGNQHGHNPSHTFVPLEKSARDPLVTALCKPGRNTSHDAICDGCDKAILGVRHKCLNCPDFDYCANCIGEANRNHSGHRFAPLYEPLAEPNALSEVHFGIYCDGPLCKGKARRSYIRGIRYKCAICHDTDFCANCEAIPTHQHNRTHPLIKFKTPVKQVSVTTVGEKANGEKLQRLGDRLPEAITSSDAPATRSVKTAATETTPVAKSTNAATQVQTMADFKPIPVEPITKPAKVADLDARFVADAVADGTTLPPDNVFTQVWTMNNPGPETWPAGCSVRFTGGDWMLNVDTKHPSSVSTIYEATETNLTQVPVKAGESFDFKIGLKTPSKEGRIISYWRLKGPDGTPFGHKLWCDVSVRSTPKEDYKATPSYVAPSVNEEADEESSKAQEGSTMVFPKLDKESPVASVHEGAQSEGTGAPTSVAAPRSVIEELLDDVESLELDDDETEDGFLTDEEYDILDASDEEFLTEAQKAVQ